MLFPKHNKDYSNSTIVDIHLMITLIKYVNQQIINYNVNFHKLVDFMHFNVKIDYICNERLTSFMFIDAFY